MCGVTLEFNHEMIDITANSADINKNLAKMVKEARAIDRESSKGAYDY